MSEPKSEKWNEKNHLMRSPKILSSPNITKTGSMKWAGQGKDKNE